MVTVYGADWCEDTQRSLRHLRRLGVMYSYENVDASAEALEHAKSLNDGKRRTPTIDVEGIILVEPANLELTRALLDRRQVTSEQVERLRVRNVGDLERGLRVVFGLGLFTAATRLKSGWRWPLMASGVYDAVTGAIGACPIYLMFGMTSTGGPGDRPREAERSCWLARTLDG